MNILISVFKNYIRATRRVEEIHDASKNNTARQTPKKSRQFRNVSNHEAATNSKSDHTAFDMTKLTFCQPVDAID